MKNKTLIRIIATLLILSLFFSGFLYHRKLTLESELGQNYWNTLALINFDVKITIDYLKSNDLNKEDIKNNFNKIFMLGAFTSTSNLISLDLHRLFFNYYDYNRIYDDSEYREASITRLTKFYDRLQYILEDAKTYKENHFISKMSNFIPAKFQAKAYYDYFSQKPSDSSKYNSKFHEVLNSNFND